MKNFHSLVIPSYLDAIVFDLDGVLIDSDQLMRYAFSEAYRQIVGEGTPPVNEYLKHLGDYFPNIMRKMGLPIEMWKVFKELSYERLDLVTVFPGIKILLEYLANSSIPMGIVTGKDGERTEHILSEFGLRQYFDIVVTPEMISHPKPHPEGLIYALNKLNTDTSNAVFVGDAVNDMLCAKSANVGGIAALWGSQILLEQVLELATYVASSPQNLLIILEENFCFRQAVETDRVFESLTSP